MLPIFSEFDINISEWDNYSKLGSECLHIHKDINLVVDIISKEIQENNEFYITGAHTYSIFMKSRLIYSFERPDIENGFLHYLEYNKRKINK